jgi:riboflavin kinase/FMN adenylyltransferase
MKVLTGRTLPEPCVLAIGKFESIHLGHQALIRDVTRLAQENGLPSAVLAFSPHPYRVLGNPGYKPLFTRNERLYLLKQLNVDYFLEYPFDETLILLDATGFVKIICEQLQAQIIVVGEGYRFGYNREGTAQTLKTTAERYKRTVLITNDFEGISTSAIRKTLHPEETAKKLGFPFFVMGVVKQGKRLGHELGFPTLNIYPPHEKYLPQYGVYVSRTIIKDRAYNSVTHVGLRPTVNVDETAPVVETHVFDFNETIYGQEIRVEFLHFVRSEQRFENLDELKIQMQKDVETVRSFI